MKLDDLLQVADDAAEIEDDVDDAVDTLAEDLKEEAEWKSGDVEDEYSISDEAGRRMKEHVAALRKLSTAVRSAWRALPNTSPSGFIESAAKSADPQAEWDRVRPSIVSAIGTSAGFCQEAAACVQRAGCDVNVDGIVSAAARWHAICGRLEIDIAEMLPASEHAKSVLAEKRQPRAKAAPVLQPVPPLPPRKHVRVRPRTKFRGDLVMDGAQRVANTERAQRKSSRSGGCLALLVAGLVLLALALLVFFRVF